jgi:hypothetical protein
MPPQTDVELTASGEPLDCGQLALARNDVTGPCVPEFPASQAQRCEVAAVRASRQLSVLDLNPLTSHASSSYLHSVSLG